MGNMAVIDGTGALVAFEADETTPGVFRTKQSVPALESATGAQGNAAWDGAAADATMVAIQKAIYAKTEAARALLAAPAGGLASQTTLAAVLAALVAGIGVTGPLTDAQLGARALATSAKQDTAKAVFDAIALSVAGATPAGENHIGAVSGQMVRVPAAAIPAVQAAAYASGNTIGGLFTLTNAMRLNAGSALLQHVAVTFKSLQTAAIEMLVFNANPATSTFTDKAAVSITDADLPKLVACVAFDKVTAVAATRTLYEAKALAQAIKVDAASRDLYAVLVARAAITFGTTTDLQTVNATMVQD
jgi:hypothetical protein